MCTKIFIFATKYNKVMPHTENELKNKKSCTTCAYVMPTDSASTNYRCGYSYYMQPAVTRKQERMDTYPEVAHDANCGHWTDHVQTILE